jgi:AraC-like DNA-binding protein
MLSMLYFPVVSALATPSPFIDKADDERFFHALREGKLHAANQLTSRWVDDAGAARVSEQAPYGFQLHADLQLLFGNDVEAEEGYRRSQKMIRSSKHAIRTASCRNTAWQSLFRHRLGTALGCFSRVIDEPEIDVERALEAQFGVVCTLHELGRTCEAAEKLQQLAGRLQDYVGAHGDLWHDLIATLRLDLAVQIEIRCAGILSDHVYWLSGLSSGRALRPERDAVDCADTLCDARVPLLRARIEYLHQLRLATCADRAAIGGLHLHLDWARDEGLIDYQRAVRLEIALATLEGATPHHAQAMLEPLHQMSRSGLTGRRQLEYLYCAAKTSQAQGRAQESMRLYSRYAFVAMQCLREDAQQQAALANLTSKSLPQLDDVGARLPARYRRAYSYMLDNLERRDLSVREVAAEIGVTERALQSAFKSFLGLTPTELIRRQRMERIRAELTHGSHGNGRGVLGAARKWGVESRSVLVNGYRKQFHEAPSETLER